MIENKEKNVLQYDENGKLIENNFTKSYIKSYNSFNINTHPNTNISNEKPTKPEEYKNNTTTVQLTEFVFNTDTLKYFPCESSIIRKFEYIPIKF